MCGRHIRCCTSIAIPTGATQTCWPGIPRTFTVATFWTWKAGCLCLLPSQVVKAAWWALVLIRLSGIDWTVMTTWTRVIDKCDCLLQTVVTSWASLAFFLTILIIVCSCCTVLRHIGSFNTECSWGTDVTNASVLAEERRVGA